MRASVVVVTHNEGEDVLRTVDGFLETIGPEDEVIVVDDCSTDRSTEVFEAGYRGVKLVKAERPLGISAARNLGGRSSSGDVIVFSDAHVDATPGWLEPLCRALEDPEVGEVTPVVSNRRSTQLKGYGFTWADPSLKMTWLPYSGATEPVDVPFICGCFLAMRRDVFDTSGGFDEGMYRWGSEDAELSLRLWLTGYRCQLVPDSDVGHLFRHKFPYQVQMYGIIYNVLRMTTVHLDEQAAGSVAAHYGKMPAFAKGWAMLIGSDTWDRRDEVHAARMRDFEWFARKFSINAFA